MHSDPHATSYLEWPLRGRVFLGPDIGKAVALALAKRRAAVAINYRERESDADAVVETIEKVACDLGRSGSGRWTIIDQAFAARWAFAGKRNRTGMVMR
jgi:hypothetical protein